MLKFEDLMKNWSNLFKRNNLPKIRLRDISYLVTTYFIKY